MGKVFIEGFYSDFNTKIKDFSENEDRAFVFDLCREFILTAKKSGNEWYKNEKVYQAVILIIYCWNFAAQKTKNTKKGANILINKSSVRNALMKNNKLFSSLEGKRLQDSLTEEDYKNITTIYSDFKDIFDQTGASKVLSVFNPNIFVMWDTGIRRYLKKMYFKDEKGSAVKVFRDFTNNKAKTNSDGIKNGEKVENYLNFIKGLKIVIDKCHLKQFDEKNYPLAKKLDEFHYAKIIV